MTFIARFPQTDFDTKLVILLHENLLQFDWLRAVVFQLNLKYLHVKITNLLRVEYCRSRTFSTVLTATNMGNKDLDKKRPRIGSSGTDTESIGAAQDGAYVKMTLTEYQSFLLRLTAINTKFREERILNLQARLDEAQVEIQALKKQLREVDKIVNNTKDSLEFTQGEHDDLVERVANCENEQSTCWDDLTHLNIYSRRWNLIFYRVSESKDEDCFSLVRDVLTRNLNLPQDEVSNMKLYGAHRLGKQTETEPDLSLLASRVVLTEIVSGRLATG